MSGVCALLLAAPALVMVGAAPANATQPAYAADDGRVVFRIRSSAVTESSSLVVSTTYDWLAYTTNDSGDDAVVYAVDTTTGRVVGRTSLAGVDAYDIEALGAGADGSLVVADVGDNAGDRDSVTVYRIDQPGRDDRAVTPDALTLRYADGPRDAEAVLYDSESGRVFVVSKEFGAHVYRTGPDAFDHGNTVLRPVAVAPPLATDATYLPGGDRVIVRGYFDATAFQTAGWTRLTRFDLPPQQQGESIAAPASGDVVWVGTEGSRSPVVEVSLPALAGSSEPSPDGSSPAAPGSADEDAAAAFDDARQVAIGVGAVALVVLLVVLALLGVRSFRSRPE